MCCNSHGLASRIPTAPPPLFSRRTHFPIPSRLILPITNGGARSFRATAAAVNGGSGGSGSVAEAEAEAVMEDLSFYELLGIPETVTSVEIKQAYKQLARKYHPDVSPPGRAEEYTERFIRVQEAYETLSDPNRRALYDRDMAMGLALSSRNQQQQMKKRSEWKGEWENQLSELRKRSMYRESGQSSSWAARMRRQNNDSSSQSQ